MIIQREKIQYNASLAITGAIKGTSTFKFYKEIDFEFLTFRRCFRKLCIFCKIKSTSLPSHLFTLFQKAVTCKDACECLLKDACDCLLCNLIKGCSNIIQQD